VGGGAGVLFLAARFTHAPTAQHRLDVLLSMFAAWRLQVALGAEVFNMLFGTWRC
jgi:hypothetical protein